LIRVLQCVSTLANQTDSNRLNPLEARIDQEAKEASDRPQRAHQVPQMRPHLRASQVLKEPTTSCNREKAPNMIQLLTETSMVGRLATTEHLERVIKGRGDLRVHRRTGVSLLIRQSATFYGCID